jgi:hypothetical protein
MRRLAAVVLFAACRFAVAGDDAFSLPDLMQELAKVPAAEAQFTEVRQLGLLRAPLELRGTLRYERPNRLERRVSFPYEETVRIDGDEVSLDNPARRVHRKFSLAKLPAAFAMIEGLRATLAGDLGALERFYQVKLAGARAAWVLSLTPRDADVASLLAQVRLRGTADRITQIEYDEAAGDRAVITVRDTRP